MAMGRGKGVLHQLSSAGSYLAGRKQRGPDRSPQPTWAVARSGWRHLGLLKKGFPDSVFSEKPRRPEIECTGSLRECGQDGSTLCLPL